MSRHDPGLYALSPTAADYRRGGGRGRPDVRRHTEVGSDCPRGVYVDFRALVEAYDRDRAKRGKPLAGAAAVVAAARNHGFRAGVYPEARLRRELVALRQEAAASVVMTPATSGIE